MTVRTRFAPSPTGLLHIGSVRTALFNYLFSRHHGGEYLLRIEDTDRARSTAANTQVILDSLAWLDLSPDRPPVFQSERETRHVEVARAMLEAGRAYLAYDSPEELQAMRECAKAEGRPPRYDGRWRDRDSADAPPGIRPAIRLKAPREGETVVPDLVQGTVRVANAELDDMIILRSDGTPTYLHAVVVDDHDMGITHVIRGDDHLTNTFRQMQVYQAMGWEPPAFAHIPLIHGADGAKLSKRHGAVSALEFREQGFLPEALCNYLLRLGWGHGDAEVVSRDEAIRLFDLADVGRAPSRMDYAKLTHLNGVYLRQADDERLTQDVLRRLGNQPWLDRAAEASIRELMPELKKRAKTLVELTQNVVSVFREPQSISPTSIGSTSSVGTPGVATFSPEELAMLRELVPLLETLGESEFTTAAIDAALRDFAQRSGRKLGQVAQPLRKALTGSTKSPPIDATLAALGREKAILRLRRLLKDS